MMDDGQLLARFVKDGSQDAFTELVARHLNFVYSAALRQVRNPQMAEDVAQLVFTNLARKAASLSGRTVLAGWLHRDARFTALDLLRGERRRQAREQEAAIMDMETHGPDTEADWKHVRPWLDEALTEMNATDRDALLLRFFEQRSFKEIGAALGSGEDAVRKRVARALDKLRELLVRRGVTTSVSALSILLEANGIQAAPASLAGSIAASSIADAAAAGSAGSIFTILKIITMSKIKTAVLVAAAVAATTVAVSQYLANEKLRAENRQLLEQSQKLGELQTENQRLANLAARAGQSRLTGAQEAELLRLRGQVGQLRKALAANRSASANKPATARSETPADPTQPFTMTLTAQVGDGQTLVTGGWSTAPGKRTFILMTPVIDPKEGSTTQVVADGRTFEVPNAKVTFQTCTVEVPEAMLEQFGLAQYKAEGQDSSVQNVLSVADAAALLKAVKNPPEGMMVSRGMITTNDGIATSISLTGSGTPSVDGQALSQSWTIGLTPNLTANRTAVNLSVQAQVARSGSAAGAN